MGKSSGGIRNAGKNPRKNLTSEQNKEFHNAAALGLFNSAVGKSKGDENDIKVGTGVFGENENWRITSKKSDLIGIFPKKNYSKDEAIKSFLEKINNKK